MEKEELYRYVDHTALKAFTTWKDIEKLCEETDRYDANYGQHMYLIFIKEKQFLQVTGKMQLR